MHLGAVLVMSPVHLLTLSEETHLMQMWSPELYFGLCMHKLHTSLNFEPFWCTCIKALKSAVLHLRKAYSTASPAGNGSFQSLNPFLSHYKSRGGGGAQSFRGETGGVGGSQALCCGGLLEP